MMCVGVNETEWFKLPLMTASIIAGLAFNHNSYYNLVHNIQAYSGLYSLTSRTYGSHVGYRAAPKHLYWLVCFNVSTLEQCNDDIACSSCIMSPQLLLLHC